MSWRTPITLVALLAVLLGAAYYGWNTVIAPSTGDDDGAVPTEPVCDNLEEFRKGQVIKADDIVVNVYNSGAIAGLAGETLAALDNRGFQPGTADNAPQGIGATNVTILTADKNAPQVQLVALQFKGQVTFEKGNALAPGIDVIVGDDFKGINREAKKTLKVKKSVSVCADVQSRET